MSSGVSINKPQRYSGSKSVPTKSTGSWGIYASPACSPMSLSSKVAKKVQAKAKGLRRSNVKGGGVGDQHQTVIPAGFAFIMLVGESYDTAEWRYVTLEYGRTLGYANQPFTVFPEVTNDMHRFWKRVVIDGAFQPNERGMWMNSMKLVEVHQTVKDVSERLFGDEEAFKDSMKLAALAKLSPAEAKLLGLDTEYTMLKIMQSGPRESEDENLASSLRDSLCGVGIAKGGI
ncbi:MAG: hypothetical protein EOP83_05485 [Verrucomicrobiaceae bacterium]|nr:MAG: hypothetical protein EOP83_05485 [Verrucomicrobiaceae bacterium]